MNITNHAYDMGKERLTLSKSSIEKLARKSLSDGVPHSQTKGLLKKYITKLYFDYKIANNIRIYGENVFIFRGSTLITVYQLPNYLKKYLKVSK